MKRIACLSLLLALAACGSSTKVVSESPKNVTIVIDDSMDALNKAKKEADAKCGAVGREASFQNVADVDGEKVAIFNCEKAQ